MKKKKVRVALRKNRQNRTRANDLTRQFPKGELSRHRTIVEDSAPDDQQAAAEKNSDTASRRPSICRYACEDASSAYTA